MRFWKLKDGSAVECYSHDFDLSKAKNEITEQEFNDFMANMPTPAPIPKTDIEKLVEYAKAQGWI